MVELTPAMVLQKYPFMSFYLQDSGDFRTLGAVPASPSDLLASSRQLSSFDIGMYSVESHNIAPASVKFWHLDPTIYGWILTSDRLGVQTITRPTTLTSVRIPDGTVGRAALSFITDTATGVYRPAANQWAVSVAGLQRLRVQSASPQVYTTGVLGVSDTIQLAASTAFIGTLTHAITAARTWTLPNVTATIATIDGGQTFTSAIWNATAIGAIYGGTGLTTYVLGDTLYSNAANSLARLAGNTTVTRNFLRQTGTGLVSAAPAWDTILAADIPASALTKVDDTNVTLTLGGSPTVALLAATSLTLGWAGTLAIARGGTNASTALANNRIIISSAGSIVETTAISANQVLYTNVNGLPIGSANLTFDGTTFSVVGGAASVNLTASLTPGVGVNALAININNASFTPAASGTHTLFAGIQIALSQASTAAAITTFAGINIPSWGTGNVTTAAGIRIAAPTGATNNYAVLTLSGDSLFDGATNRIAVTGFLRVGTATDASAQGDAVFGLTGAARLLYKQSTAIATLYSSGGVAQLKLDAAAARINWNSVAAPGAPANGDVWNDSTQLTHTFYPNGLVQYLASGIAFQTSTATVANTIAESSFVSVQLPANFLVVGKTLRIKAYGLITTKAAPVGSLNLRIKLGATVICTTAAFTPVASLSNNEWIVDCTITCRSTGAAGTVFGMAYMLTDETSPNPTWHNMANTAATTVDTTAALLLNFTVQWGTADVSNSISLTVLPFEVLG